MANHRFWLNPFSVLIVITFFMLTAIACTGAGPYPEPISTRKEINAAKPTLDSIDIWNLPLADFSLLSKFTDLKRVWFGGLATFAQDAKLKALADIGFTNLAYINLNNCRLVTDKGLEALSRIRSLTQITLEGTTITDHGCDIIASKMSLEMVNVANCSGVTLKGLEALASSKSLNYFSFSSEKLTQQEVLSLIDSFKSIKRCEVVDIKGSLDAGVVKAKGEAQSVHVSVRPTGALQEMKLYNDK